jgi:hypothetical protein
MGRGVKWLASCVAGGLLLVSAVSVSNVVARASAPAAAAPVLMSAVEGTICKTTPVTSGTATAQQASSCAACFECTNREGPSDRCLALCERLQCDPGAGNPRCEAIVLCIIGYRWDANACQCLPDQSGN